MLRLLSALLVISAPTFALQEMAPETTQEEPSRSYNYYFQNAKEAYMNKRYDEATRLIQQSITESSSPTQKLDSLNAAGWIAFSKGDYQQSRQLYLDAASVENVPELYPTLEKLNHNRAILEYVVGNISAAKSLFNQSVIASTDVSQSFMRSIANDELKAQANKHVQEGVAHRFNKNFEQAIIEYDKALALMPDNAEALEYKGYAMLKTNQLEESLMTLQRAFEVDPLRLNTLINLFKVHCQLGNLEATVSIAQQNGAILSINRKNLANDKELQALCGENLNTILNVL
ncbi:tetratricopeptide repeat protein [Planctobacterium marinum]|uniref:Tetratricopeptide repeat protein n=1 Tax=Planctobacterium marinum TaxID=1631968 RepID=A0AA48KS66_9ALTE|nr:hypothetical protein MACH26_16900 [Planctobacterium marinum]